MYMAKYVKIPSWITDGPMDYEFKSYKMYSELEALSKQLANGKLFEVLLIVDETLEYLYKYDGDRLTSDYTTSDYELIGIDWQNFNLEFIGTDATLKRDDILDSICELAIDKYEDFHEKIRQIWKDIESGVTLTYIPSKPYFAAPGFVFITTPDNMLHIYYFNKPGKYSTTTWKEFKLEYNRTETYIQESYFKYIDELTSSNSEKIIFKVNCNNNIKIEGNSIAIIQHKIYNKLKQDLHF